ncbi:MAG: ABC transporter ATP-binding protein, partial [Bacteriovoracaceae bacterium]
TFGILTGLLSADSGELSLFDEKVLRKGKQLTKSNQYRSIGYLPEKAPLYGYMRVREFIEFAYDIHSPSGINKKSALDRAIELCGLEDVKHQTTSTLSKGFKQRVALASTIVYNPKLLILDEPFSGLDPEATHSLRELILKLKGEHTIIFSSHQLSEVERVCERLSILKKGEVIFNGSQSELANEYESNHFLRINVDSWRPEIESALKEKFSLELIEKNSLQTSGLSLKFKTPSKEGGHNDLMKFLLDKDVCIHSIEKGQSNLEELFENTLASNLETLQ